jgi:hypothetical protein
MTLRTHRLLSLAVALRAALALAAAAAALAAAGPAGAEPNVQVDENGKKSCTMQVAIDGTPPRTTYFPHGSTTTVSGPKGGTVKLKCDDGTWKTAELVRSRFTAPTEWTVNSDELGRVTLLVAA